MNKALRSETYEQWADSIKSIFSEKATKFCDISAVDLSYVLMVKSMVEILQNSLAFPEYKSFKWGIISQTLKIEFLVFGISRLFSKK